jgi:hypothetical protein
VGVNSEVPNSDAKRPKVERRVLDSALRHLFVFTVSLYQWLIRDPFGTYLEEGRGLVSERLAQTSTLPCKDRHSMRTPGQHCAGCSMAGGRGFEPRLTDPESAVLPLDEPPITDGILP